MKNIEKYNANLDRIETKVLNMNELEDVLEIYYNPKHADELIKLRSMVIPRGTAKEHLLGWLMEDIPSNTLLSFQLRF